MTVGIASRVDDPKFREREREKKRERERERESCLTEMSLLFMHTKS